MKEMLELYKQYTSIKEKLAKQNKKTTAIINDGYKLVINKDLQLQLYSILIDQRECQADVNSLIIRQQVRSNPNYFSFMDSCNFNISVNDSFIVGKAEGKHGYPKSFVKYYMSIPDEKKEQFMIDYSHFCIDNKIKGYYKIRTNEDSNDFLTVRVYEPENYQKVFDFIKEYVNPKIKQHIFMPTINNIGVTYSDESSYNEYLTDTLLLYFESIKSIDDISVGNYMKFTKKRKTVANLVTLNLSYSEIINHLNLESAMSKSISLDELTRKIEETQRSSNEELLYRKYEETARHSFIEALYKCSIFGRIEGMEELISKNKTGDGYLEYDKEKYIEEQQQIKRINLKRIKDFPDYKDGMEFEGYINMQFQKIDSNIEKICYLLEHTTDQKEIEYILENVDEIIANENNKYNINADIVYLPTFLTDDLHTTYYNIMYSENLNIMYGENLYSAIRNRLCTKYDYNLSTNPNTGYSKISGQEDKSDFDQIVYMCCDKEKKLRTTGTIRKKKVNK